MAHGDYRRKYLELKNDHQEGERELASQDHPLLLITWLAALWYLNRRRPVLVWALQLLNVCLRCKPSWHQGLVHDAVACASFLKLHSNLPKQVDPIVLRGDLQNRKTHEEKANAWGEKDHPLLLLRHRPNSYGRRHRQRRTWTVRMAHGTSRHSARCLKLQRIRHIATFLLGHPRWASLFDIKHIVSLIYIGLCASISDSSRTRLATFPLNGYNFSSSPRPQIAMRFSTFFYLSGCIPVFWPISNLGT